MAARFYPLIALPGILFLASVGAHDVVDSVEFEVVLVEDELDDAPYTYGGYDLGTLSLGEAYVPETGDGLYFHVQLFGPYKAGTGEWSVKFTVTTPAGPLVRTLRTMDGTTFTSDFDVLTFKQSSESTDVRRAFISLEKANLHRGDKITGFVVESYVDGDLRDRAPGPLYVPGSGGNVEMMCTTPPGKCKSVVAQESYVVLGPVQYISVVPQAAPGGLTLEVKNRLAKGGQHVHVESGALTTDRIPGAWVGSLTSSGASVAGGKSWSTSLTAAPAPDAQGNVAPLRVNVTSDLGGRLELVLTNVGDRVEAAIEGGTPVSWAIDAPAEAPGASVILGIVGLVAAFALTGRR